MKTSYSRYEFRHTKIGVVTFGEDKRTHKSQMNEGEWKLGFENVYEPYEYKNLGVTRNCFRSFASDIEDNIAKTRKKQE